MGKFIILSKWKTCSFTAVSPTAVPVMRWGIFEGFFFNTAALCIIVNFLHSFQFDPLDSIFCTSKIIRIADIGEGKLQRQKWALQSELEYTWAPLLQKPVPDKCFEIISLNIWNIPEKKVNLPSELILGIYF